MKVNEFDFDVLAERIKTLENGDHALLIEFASVFNNDSIYDASWEYGIKRTSVLDCDIIAYGSIGSSVINTHSAMFEEDIEEALE